MQEQLSVREIQQEDIVSIINYWSDSAPGFMQGMGVDLSKMPKEEEWHQMLSEQIAQSYSEKKSYCIIWLLNNKAIGHSNVNKIIFGQEAYMHLHIWCADKRSKGLGSAFIKMSLPLFFEKLQLKKIFCEPYALNPAPNKTLKKTGFSLVKEYITTPGWINFEQPVKLWELTLEKLRQMNL